MKAKVCADVEGRQLSVYVCINNSQQIYSHKSKDTEVAIPSEEVLLVLEYVLESFLFSGNIIPYGQHLLVAFCHWVRVHDVEICLRIVVKHLGVPSQCIYTSQESSVDDRQFPVLMIVNLPPAGEDQSQPHGANGVWDETLSSHRCVYSRGNEAVRVSYHLCRICEHDSFKRVGEYHLLLLREKLRASATP